MESVLFSIVSVCICQWAWT